MFKRKFCIVICFLYSVLAISPVQAMFSSRSPKVRVPKARPATKAPTIPKTPTLPKTPSVSTPEMASSEMFEPSVSTFSTSEEISPFTEVPTVSTKPTISTEPISRAPRAPRSTSAAKGSPSLWDRFKMYWTQKRAYYTTVPTYQEKKSPGSSAGVEFNFTFSKLFKFQNPFSFKTWSTGGTKYSSRSSRMSPEEIDKWFNDYIERKNLSRGMYRERVDVMKHILGNAKNDSEAADYLYNALEYVFANMDEDDKKDPKIISDMNQLALVALSMKLDRFVNFFKLNGFPTTSSYYEQKYGSAGSSEKAESGKQEQKKEQSYEKKQEEPRAESSTGESFWSQAKKQYRYNQYDTDKKRKERIWDILAKGNYSKEDIEDVYNLFEAMLTNADSNYVVPTFINMTKFGIGKGDARYKTLYGRVKPRDKKTLEGDMPDDIAIAQRLNLVLCILNSFYKDDPNAIYYAYALYSELPPRYQLQNFSLIIKNGGTKISPNFRNLLGLLSLTEIGQIPNISLIHAIKTYDSDNKEAMAYANRMFEKLKTNLKAKATMGTDNIELIEWIVYEANARADRQRANGADFVIGQVDATLVALLLEEAFESFKKNNIDPREKYRFWTYFYKELDKVYSDLNNPLEKIFEKYGFHPSQRSQQQSGYSSGARQEKSYHRPSSAGRAKVSDYDILGVKQGTSSEEMHKKYLELVNKYHPDKIRSRGGSEQEMKEGEQKLKVINAAYDRIGRK